MSGRILRFRMFAGPNGSGKSVIKSAVPATLLGVYVNPDEIEKIIRESDRWFDFSTFQVRLDAGDFRSSLSRSEVLVSKGISLGSDSFICEGNRVRFSDSVPDSYLGSSLADYLRTKLMESSKDFSTETVMSHSGKVDLLRLAQERGYRTYLYYVATEDPEINVFRVAQRVREGGHDVEEKKIRQRYVKSLNLIQQALPFTNRAYFFDNSSDGMKLDEMWFAEVTDGETLEFRSDKIPDWFRRSVWDPSQTTGTETDA